MESLILQQMAANGPLVLIFGVAFWRLEKRITIIEANQVMIKSLLELIEKFIMKDDK